MTTNLLAGVDMATGNGLTTDDPRTLVALKVVPATQAERDAIVRLVLDKRARWRTYVTIRQREWQTKVSRRPNRGPHHDSWNIRERYVRC